MVDQSIESLSDPARHRVLQALQNHDYPIEAPSLVVSEADFMDESVKNQKVELYHNHLPKLDDAGLIEWDREEEVVEKGPRFEEVHPLLDFASENIDDDTDNSGNPRLGGNIVV